MYQNASRFPGSKLQLLKIHVTVLGTVTPARFVLKKNWGIGAGIGDSRENCGDGNHAAFLVSLLAFAQTVIHTFRRGS